MRYSAQLMGHLDTRITGKADSYDDLKNQIDKINSISQFVSVKSVTVFFRDLDGGLFDEEKND